MKTPPSEKPIFRKLTQVGMVVQDAEATARRYWEDLGIGPWRIYTVDPSNTAGTTLRGKPVKHAFRAALAMIGDVALELIQPLEGESLYAEHLSQHGEGLHHLAFDVANYEETKTRLRRKGYSEIQGGEPFGVCTYSYFDTHTKLAFMSEFGSGFKAGRSMPDPSLTIP